MSEWSLECDVWESKFSENNSEPSIRHAYAAGWNRHKEIHSKAAQKNEEAPGTIDNNERLAIALLNKLTQLQPQAKNLWSEHQLVNDILDEWRSATSAIS